MSRLPEPVALVAGRRRRERCSAGRPQHRSAVRRSRVRRQCALDVARRLPERCSSAWALRWARLWVEVRVVGDGVQVGERVPLSDW